MKRSRLFSPEKTGLAVVDVQEKLFSHIADNATVARNVCRAVRAASLLEMSITVVEQYVRGLGPTISEVKSAVEESGVFAPMEKRSFSCFDNAAFAAAFEKSDLRALAICGIEAHVCVLQTALDALDRGIDVFLITDACGSRNAGHKEEAVIRLRDAGCIAGPLEMLVFEMMRTSEHPAFRAVQRVIL